MLFSLEHVLLASVIVFICYVLWLGDREKAEDEKELAKIFSDQDEHATRSPSQAGKRKSFDELMREAEEEAAEEMLRAVQKDSATISLSPPSDSEGPTVTFP